MDYDVKKAGMLSYELQFLLDTVVTLWDRLRCVLKDTHYTLMENAYINTIL